MFGRKKRDLALEMGKLVLDNIEKHGQHVMSVSAGTAPAEGDFAYTIGNHECGMPELVITGAISYSFAPLLNRLGELQRERGFGFRDNEIVSLGGKYPVYMVDAGDTGRTQCAIFVGSYYGTDNFALLQVIFPDPEGRWPGDPDCAEGFASQRILKSDTGVPN